MSTPVYDGTGGIGGDTGGTGGTGGTDFQPAIDALQAQLTDLEVRVADLEAFRTTITTEPGGPDLYAPSFHAAIDVTAGNDITAGNNVTGKVVVATRKFKGDWLSQGD